MAESILSMLSAANDTFLTAERPRVATILDRAGKLDRAATALVGARAAGYHMESLASAYALEKSRYFRSPEVAGELARCVRFIEMIQYDDGSFDAGNRKSPPDTAFILRSLSATLQLLLSADAAELDGVRESLRRVILKGAEILVTGGIHTPNHRWIVCDALARANELAHDRRFVDRIGEWLSEGIDIDPDGQFSERSVGIYSAEVDKALISIAVRIGRSELLNHVRRNLETTLCFVEPDGELQTIGSRRQDQSSPGSISRYYLPYRFMAALDSSPLFESAAHQIEQLFGAKLRDELIYLLAGEYQPGTRETATVDPRTNAPRFEAADFLRNFTSMGVVRIRKGRKSATILGGTDWPLGSASGLSSSPTFFTFRNGNAILDSVRLATDFFSMGYFRSERIIEQAGRYLLAQTIEVPYYQPLPPALRRTDGLYELSSADGRFSSRMSFPSREPSNIQTLTINVEIQPADHGGYTLAFRIEGCDNVPVAIEFALRSGGSLSGVTGPLGQENIFALESGFARYERAGYTIQFGPGAVDFLWGDDLLPHLPGFLAPQPDAVTVYITGHTPFRREIEVN